MALGPVPPVPEPICHSGLGHEMEASARREEPGQPCRSPREVSSQLGGP